MRTALVAEYGSTDSRPKKSAAVWQNWQLTPPSNALVTPVSHTVQLTTPGRQQPCFEALLQQMQTED